MSYDYYICSQQPHSEVYADVFEIIREMTRHAHDEKIVWAFQQFGHAVRWYYDFDDGMLRHWLRFSDDAEAVMFKVKFDVPQDKIRKVASPLHVTYRLEFP